MQRALIIASILGLVMALAASNNACGGDDSSDATTDGSTTAQDDALDDLCNSFNGTGNACSPISTERCFPDCTNGGCFCTAGPNGTGIWQCVTDTSCYPDAAPVVTSEDGSANSDDASTPDAMSDANVSDATANDASDANASDANASDANASDAGDASD